MLDPPSDVVRPLRPRESLTRRELEVLELTAEGLTNGQVAAHLHVTVHAIKFHLASIYRKLGVGNRTEAAVAYLRAPHELTTDVTER